MKKAIIIISLIVSSIVCSAQNYNTKNDTIRVIILAGDTITRVSYKHPPVFWMHGYVVISAWDDNIYLDRQKKPLKKGIIILNAFKEK